MATLASLARKARISSVWSKIANWHPWANLAAFELAISIHAITRG